MLAEFTVASLAMVVWGLITADWIRVGFGVVIFLLCFLIEKSKMRKGDRRDMR